MEKVRQVDIQMRYTRMGDVFMIEITCKYNIPCIFTEYQKYSPDNRDK